MKNLVIDASVVVKWTLPEEDSEHALALHDAHLEQNWSLLAPTLILTEVANAFWKRRDQMDVEIAQEALSALLASGIELVPIEYLFAKAHRLACQHGRTVYDALYLALAQQRGCDFVTADERLYNAVKDQLPWVKWLRHIPQP
jgi:predicted nucleic acid-binding protein